MASPNSYQFQSSEIGAVPIPINRSEAEIGAVLTTIQGKKILGRTVLVTI